MDKVYKALVIDDEPPARDLLEAFIKHVSYLEFSGSCSNAMMALEAIARLKPDLIFLDINMPQMTGLEMLGLNEISETNVILTTAHAEHALKSYEFGVTDYLLKPIAFDRFLKAVIKFKNFRVPGNETTTKVNLDNSDSALMTPDISDDILLSTSSTGRIWIREEKTILQIHQDEVLFIEGMKDYVKVHLLSRAILTHMSIGIAEETFKSPLFIRIHRSFIVRQSAIKSIHGNFIKLENNRELPIGPFYREELKRHISLL